MVTLHALFYLHTALRLYPRGAPERPKRTALGLQEDKVYGFI